MHLYVLKALQTPTNSSEKLYHFDASILKDNNSATSYTRNHSWK